jgi:hypothetical protein
MTARSLRSLLPTSLLLTATCASAGSSAEPAGFRISDLDLRDPHVFVTTFTCSDLTDTPFLGFSVNGVLQQRIQLDGDADGLLDLSYLIEFLPLDRSQPTNLIDFGSAECSAPLAASVCSPVLTSAIAGDATLQDTGTCAAADPLTLRPYAPAVGSSTGPCFVSPTGSVALDLAGLPITLQQATIAATFVGNPGDGLVNGLLRGFISEADADAIVLPPTLPLIGGQPLSSLLPGGSGNCAAFSDQDPLGGEAGWWFHLNFSAERVEVTFADGFLDGFESN